MQRLLDGEPDHIYLTHFGRVDQVQALGEAMLALLGEVVALGEQLRTVPDRDNALRQGLQTLYLHSLRAHGCTLPDATLLEQLALDIELNAQGMGIWLDRPR